MRIARLFERVAGAMHSRLRRKFAMANIGLLRTTVKVDLARLWLTGNSDAYTVPIDWSQTSFSSRAMCEAIFWTISEKLCGDKWIIINMDAFLATIWFMDKMTYLITPLTKNEIDMIRRILPEEFIWEWIFKLSKAVIIVELSAHIMCGSVYAVGSGSGLIDRRLEWKHFLSSMPCCITVHCQSISVLSACQ